MGRKQKQQQTKQEGSDQEAGPSGQHAAAEPLHRTEALRLLAQRTRRDFEAEVERLESRIQQDKQRLRKDWRKAYVDDEVDGDPALLYWITVRSHKEDEWFVTYDEFLERRQEAEWKGTRRASFAVVSFKEEAVQARKVAHTVEQAAKGEAHFQKQVAADRERRGLSVA